MDDFAADNENGDQENSGEREVKRNLNQTKCGARRLNGALAALRSLGSSRYCHRRSIARRTGLVIRRG
jgi:hypothetical protein